MPQKLTKKELEKNFDITEEDAIYQAWEKSGMFNPDNLNLPADAPSYTIILPPPNITDKLHIGHAAMVAIEDLFIRYHRLKGERTLWLPGTDHAAIATQSVVERKLKEQGTNRNELGREKFLEQVNAFVAETQAVILNQIKKLGASLDWSRLAFTLDEPRQAAVKEMFVRMHEEGLIYRGERVVNWCPNCGSTLADDEVEYEAQTAKLYTFRYSADFPIAISTTRPETKLGDTAVAVNPKDERYRDYIGREFKVDFCGVALTIKIIADRHVDMAFGTGAVGVTPAHSFADAQLGETEKLPVVKVIGEDARILAGFGEFSGLNVAEAREKIADKLRASGLLEKEEDITNNLSVCYRCGSPIEPLPSRQWFLAVDKPLKRLGNQSLKQAALAVGREKIEFLPSRFQKKYLDWMENLKDWCLSRQIWFGHRLPVYYHATRNTQHATGDTQQSITEEQDHCNQPVVTRENLTHCQICGEELVQDSDTLDTWFSSGMWTFSTLGYPQNFVDNQKTGDLAKFHPTQVLETGYEIITLWVSRMVMMSLFALGEAPFERVYLHGLVLDKQGKKMSKTKGNGIDPLEMIAKYGTDATRLSLLIGATPGNDFRFYEERTEDKRNFVNKLWNIARYIYAKLPDEQTELAGALTLPDRYLLSRWEKIKQEVAIALESYEFSSAGDKLKSFTVDELADWYLESSKFLNNQATGAVMAKVLKELLILWHPFMPFVTEKLWQEGLDSNLTQGQLLTARWPQTDQGLIDEAAEAEFETMKQIVTAIRNARAANKISPSRKLKALMIAREKIDLAAIKPLIVGLRTGLESVDLTEQPEPAAIFAALPAIDIYLLGAVNGAEEKERLNKECAQTEKYVLNLRARLENQEFVSQAPEAIVAGERRKLAEAEEKLKAIKERLEKI